MERFIIKHSKPLSGEVSISGSKNAVLPIMAGSLLSRERSVIANVPCLSDVRNMAELMSTCGAEVELGEELCIECKDIATVADNIKAKELRASVLLAGAILGRCGRVELPMPGGCGIGLRPIDLHLKGFCAMGAQCSVEHGMVRIEAEGGRLKGAEIYLDFPSVGATENIMLAAVLARGTTVISNCAVEPEIIDLATFLNKLGARIYGAGTDTVTIEGVAELGGCRHRVIPDRIEAGTYMLAVAATCGRAVIKNIVCDHLRSVISKLREVDAYVSEGDGYLEICSDNRVANTDIKTLPYPGFPTDMQAQFMGLMARGLGTGIINETVFENRFLHVGELLRLGADITINGRCAVVKGVDVLSGAKVRATDLRAGAALIISALMAEGTTEIEDIHHIDRGYERVVEKLKGLGADIERINEPDL
jgi:UDP-N-acetylglucosamine 1-carboxyvinyltransferase